MLSEPFLELPLIFHAQKSRLLLSIDLQQPLPNTQFKVVDLYSGNDIGKILSVVQLTQFKKKKPTAQTPRLYPADEITVP